MKKGHINLIKRIVENNIRKENKRVCLGFGYQPIFPKSAKEFMNRKK